MPRSALLRLLLAAGWWIATASAGAVQDLPDRPNVVVILVEDASAHLGYEGEALAYTPAIDRLADEGVRFSAAFVTNPICSPSRTALVTGMYPTTFGGMNHRGQVREGKGSGNVAFYDSYELPVDAPFLPRLFQEAGYYTVQGGPQREGSLGKSDYNFEWDRLVYDADDWAGRAPGQPFFAQIHLVGGKIRRDRRDEYAQAFRRARRPVDPAAVALPPYYPDHPVLREDWAAYLATWDATDQEVRDVLDRLDREGLADSTVVVFLTDHGVSHLRGKQFLYDEGLRVPLVVRFPGGWGAGTERTDLVEHIDLAPTLLAWAGIDIPAAMQGRDLFPRDLRPRPYVFGARDRADETVDLSRAVRTDRFKYIRNVYSDRPHLQPNRYKDGKAIVQVARALQAEGRLGPLADTPLFTDTRPPEELYDLDADPHELTNLAGDPAFRPVLDSLRGVMVEWMVRSGDLGLVPEPVLEEWGGRYGWKGDAWRHLDLAALTRQSLATVEAAERGDRAALLGALADTSAVVRYWAAYGLGRPALAGPAVRPALRAALDDPTPTVRAAAARSLALAGDPEAAVPVLARLLADDNVLVGLYAAWFVEELDRRQGAFEPGTPGYDRLRPAVEAAADSPFEFTRRTARRLLGRGRNQIGPGADAAGG